MSLSAFRVVALTAIVLPTSALAASPGQSQLIQRRPPFLKINDYTVLYLNPVAPYQDAQGTLVAPASRLAALLGVGAKTAPDGNSVTLSGNGHTITFKVGSPTQVGVKSKFSKPTRWHGTGEMIVSVEAVAFGLGLRSEWDTAHRVFQMHSDKALSAEEEQIQEQPHLKISPDPAVSAVSFRLMLLNKPQKQYYSYRLRVVLHSGNDHPIRDDSVLDVMDDQASEEEFGGGGCFYRQLRHEATVRSGQTYPYTITGSSSHPVMAIIIAAGSALR